MTDSRNLVTELENLIAFVDSFQPAANAPVAMSSAPASRDKAFDPVVPPGHTKYSWGLSKPKTVLPFQSRAKPQVKKQKKESTKPKGKAQPKAKGAKAEGGEFARRNRLLEMQNQTQKLWDKNKVFESNPEDGREKFMCTFPYPYMNGWLHLGHAFSMSKAEFAAGYQRLKEKNVLFPFGFHCTGMPIPACALRLQDEVKQYGNPPKFPVEQEQQKGGGKKKKGKKKGKGKAAKKKSGARYQWQIMKEFGLKDDEIAKFQDVNTWLDHFPPLGMEHLKKFGCKVDFRRSFITTSANPYYDAFIRWQFNTLKERGKLIFGNRPCVWDTRTNQVCADHDRSEGEQVNPQNYTLIKMKVLPEGTPYTESKGADPLQEFFATGKPMFMVAGTLRPETMYGQTNCFVLPSGQYCIVETKDGELWVTGEMAARNMAWQEMLHQTKDMKQGEFKILGKVSGKELLGRKVEAPLAKYPFVYVLPLLTISMDKATGVVTSVPSDAPDDWAALMDMKKNAKQRKQYHITEEMVNPFEVVEIIEIPSTDDYPQLGRKSAADFCVSWKVKNQKDTDKLKEIKDICYKYGFDHGKMIVGEFAGKPVKEAKQMVKDHMIKNGLAANYWEPEDIVISRTGDRCVVNFTDQWFLQYGEENWRALVEKHMEGMEFYNPKTRAEFVRILGWLHEWACSREFGAGTKLPIDDRFVIESLSDSTIYMAYYTICHHLQGNCNLKGEGSDIDPTSLTDAVFDYIFLGKAMPDSPISKKKLEKMREEFMYWYPMDLRVSGKDLIGNHLTFTLYNHSAIWNEEPDRWPLSYYTNGHVMVDGEKMSKSSGNFITLSDGCDDYSSDAIRFGLADAGDGLLDANFDRKVTNAAILNLTKEENWITEQMEQIDFLRTGDYTDMDRMFDNAMSNCVSECHEAYEMMQYKQALRYGWHKLRRYRDFWRSNCEGLHKDLVIRFIEVELVMLTPFCPHFCEFMWQKLQGMGFPGAKGFIVNASWPETREFDYTLNMQFDYIQEVRHLFQKEFASADRNRKKLDAKKKTKTPEFNACRVFVANKYLDYQIFVLQTMKDLYDEEANFVNPSKYRPIFLKADFETKKTMDFATMIAKDHLPERGAQALSTETPFDEIDTIRKNLQLIIGDVAGVPAKNIFIYDIEDANKDDPKGVSNRAIPLSPKIQFYTI